MQRIRENAKLLFTSVIDDATITTLLNNRTVDEVILHVLKLSNIPHDGFENDVQEDQEQPAEEEEPEETLEHIPPEPQPQAKRGRKVLKVKRTRCSPRRYSKRFKINAEAEEEEVQDEEIDDVVVEEIEAEEIDDVVVEEIEEAEAEEMDDAEVVNLAEDVKDEVEDGEQLDFEECIEDIQRHVDAGIIT